MIDEKKLIRAMWDRYNGDYNNASRFFGEETEMAYRVLSDLQLTIEHMPKVGEWISVKDRLPERDVDVLVTDRVTGEVTTAHLNDFDCFVFEDGRGHGANAWQPLPEPYKE